MTGPDNPSWYEHVDFMQVAIVALIVVVVYFLRRYFESQIKINTDLYEKYNKLSADFHELKGAHDATIHGKAVSKSSR